MFTERDPTPLELHIVWVVNAPSLNVSGAPIEGCVTIWTPHLGTPTQFLYHRSTFGAGLCILLEKFHSLDCVLVTFMPLTQLLIAMFTKVIVTETTKPIFIHEPLTFFCGTLTNELFGWLTYHEISTMPKSLKFPITL